MPHKLLEEIRHWIWPAGPDGAAAADGGPGAMVAASPCAFVVDDEGSICKIISMLLATAGVEAHNFHAADDAIVALDRQRPQIVFLDIALRQSDAIDVIRGLGAKQYCGAVQLMSGSDPGLLEDVRRIGMRHGLDMWPAIK